MFLASVVLAGCAGADDGADSGTPDATVLDEGWQCHWGDLDLAAAASATKRGEEADDAWFSCEKPLSPPGERQDILWVRVRLPARLTSLSSLAAPPVMSAFEAYVDTALVYRFGHVDSAEPGKYALVTPHVFGLLPESGGKTLYLRIRGRPNDRIGLTGAPIVGQEVAVIRKAFRIDVGRFLLGAVCTVIGLIALLVGVRTRDSPRRRLLLYLSLFSTSFGLAYVAGNAISLVAFPIPALWYYVAACFFVFPVGILGFVEQLMGSGPARVLHWLKYAHVLLVVVALSVDMAGLAPAYAAQPVFFVLLTGSLVAMVATTIPQALAGGYEARIVCVGLLVVFLAGMHDTVFHGFGVDHSQPSLAPGGVVIFLLFMGYLAEFSFSEAHRKMRIYSEELEIANRTLEEYRDQLENRVEVRTRQLSEKNDELESTLVRLQATKQQLVQSEKLASLGRVTAGIAHEIKNPLNFVNNFATLSAALADELKEKLSAAPEPLSESDPEVEEILSDLVFNSGKIREHGQRADSIIKSMLQHSRGKVGAREPRDLNRLLKEYVDLAYHGMRARYDGFNAALEMDMDPAVGHVPVVAEDIGRVFLNLIDNAGQAVMERQETASSSEYQPTIRVETKALGDEVEIRISDNGPGVSDSLAEHIFEPFFTTKDAGHGTGLGLSLAHEIVHDGHQGSITVESDAEGATFIVRLPGQSGSTAAGGG